MNDQEKESTIEPITIKTKLPILGMRRAFPRIAGRFGLEVIDSEKMIAKKVVENVGKVRLQVRADSFRTVMKMQGDPVNFEISTDYQGSYLVAMSEINAEMTRIQNAVESLIRRTDNAANSDN